MPGGQLIQNAVDLDCHSHRHACECYGSINLGYHDSLDQCHKGCLHCSPLTALLDFAAAFPSVANRWINAAWISFKIPQCLLDASGVLYRNHEGFAQVGDITKWVFGFRCGVLQGCPFSGTPPVIAIDPVLTLFKKRIQTPGLGQVYACAADIRAALKNFESMRVCSKLSEVFRKPSGPTLKPMKFLAIPVSIDLSEGNLRVLRDEIA